MSQELLNQVQPNHPPDTARDKVIEAHDLVKRYKDFEAVKGINFEVYQQECFGILGPNGAGKSSTIKMLHCMSPVTAGTLRVLGEPTSGNARWIKAQLGVVSQDDNLDPDLDVLQNLLAYARYFGIEKKEALKRADEALELFQLTEKRKSKTDELSGGMKRRLVIARALTNRPRMIILDEPTTGLDPAARQLVWQKLRYLRDTGVTLILTTHYMEEAAQLCDRLVVMHEGKILAEGSPAKLVEEQVGVEVMELRLASAETDVEPIKAAIANSPVHYEQSGDMFYLFANQSGVLQQLQLPEVKTRLQRQASLEDVFLRLTGRGLNE